MKSFGKFEDFQHKITREFHWPEQGQIMLKNETFWHISALWPPLSAFLFSSTPALGYLFPHEQGRHPLDSTL
jgi:hypothetical protein